MSSTMSIDLVLASIEEYLELKGFTTSGTSDPKQVQEAKARVARACHQFVEYRITHALDVRRRSMSAERIKIADSMNSNLKDMATSVKSLTALNSAPPPMMPDELNKKTDLETWMKAYTEWYNSDRSNGMKIG